MDDQEYVIDPTDSHNLNMQIQESNMQVFNSLIEIQR